MNLLLDRFCRVLDAVMVVLLALMVLLVFGNVVLRYALTPASPSARRCRAGCSCG